MMLCPDRRETLLFAAFPPKAAPAADAKDAAKTASYSLRAFYLLLEESRFSLPRFDGRLLDMAKFYFHILEYNVLVADEEGLELRDFAEARLEAVHTAKDLVQADFGGGVAISEGEILIADRGGTILERLPLRGVLH